MQLISCLSLTLPLSLHLILYTYSISETKIGLIYALSSRDLWLWPLYNEEMMAAILQAAHLISLGVYMQIRMPSLRPFDHETCLFTLNWILSQPIEHLNLSLARNPNERFPHAEGISCNPMKKSMGNSSSSRLI